MNRLDPMTRTQIVAALVAGNSVRSTCRMTGAAKGTVLKLLAELGAACDDYQDRAIFGLKTKRLQCDEIWSFCYAKHRNVPERMKRDPGVGSIWTWTALDADSKLIVTWYIGSRDPVRQPVHDRLREALLGPGSADHGRPQPVPVRHRGGL
ncbi:MAG TPA: hypothetical protein VG734_23150 [Lacunisphaera sp.]|nr:hypothetical protein [Lacunisphaera sp.]